MATGSDLLRRIVQHIESPILEIRDLVKRFPLKSGILRRTFGYVRAVDGVSFKISRGETFGLAGESGCGKTTVANLILKLLEPTGGDILFQGQSLGEMPQETFAEYRRAVQAVFQDPYGALNPRMTVGGIITEPLRIQGYPKSHRLQRLKEVLSAVGLPRSSATQYPHEFSGGQRQRIAVARALATEPKLIVLDEPVSCLDVSIRSQVLNLLIDIQEERRISYLLISHDLATLEHVSHRIGVMYLGRLVEVGRSEEVCQEPAHPYTASLVAAATPPGQQIPWQVPIIGNVPRNLDVLDGCAFYPRCPYVMEDCRSIAPTLERVDNSRLVACHLHPDRIAAINKRTA
jgi:oligopeptide/dipeptide ABC transporter ATP-binding protein